MVEAVWGRLRHSRRGERRKPSAISPIFVVIAGLYQTSHPERVYPDFASIPPLVVKSLLFVEDRDRPCHVKQPWRELNPNRC